MYVDNVLDIKVDLLLDENGCLKLLWDVKYFSGCETFKFNEKGNTGIASNDFYVIPEDQFQCSLMGYEKCACGTFYVPILRQVWDVKQNKDGKTELYLWKDMLLTWKFKHKILSSIKSKNIMLILNEVFYQELYHIVIN